MPRRPEKRDYTRAVIALARGFGLEPTTGAVDLVRKSEAAGHAYVIMASVYNCRCGGMTAPGLCWAMGNKFALRTIEGKILDMRRHGLIRKTGGVARTRTGGPAEVYVPVTGKYAAAAMRRRIGE